MLEPGRYVIVDTILCDLLSAFSGDPPNTRSSYKGCLGTVVEVVGESSICKCCVLTNIKVNFAGQRCAGGTVVRPENLAPLRDPDAEDVSERAEEVTT